MGAAAGAPHGWRELRIGQRRDPGSPLEALHLLTCAPTGDFIEFFAEVDLLGALSACPGGDCSATHSSDAAACYPLKIEIFEPDRTTLGSSTWPSSSRYHRRHGTPASFSVSLSSLLALLLTAVNDFTAALCKQLGSFGPVLCNRILKRRIAHSVESVHVRSGREQVSNDFHLPSDSRCA